MSNLLTAEENKPIQFANILSDVINKAVFENPSDIRKIVEQLDSVIVGIDRIKGGLQQVLRHQLINVESFHPISVTEVHMNSEDKYDVEGSLYHYDDENTDFDNIEHDIQEVGQRVDKVEVEVQQ